ncbi:BQ5605_C003g02521 [Microbotryum silenes-dioicae]|uniref:BQ5605_C003g02521 protein n=1 Tax=Microbotryum silenes-dioicae TaxID=796604 RepID=A0A2X0P4V0_9BASI|nr:BQ5605_C003g02521 [Microbotryum silenes-dioicae]
MFFPSLRSGVVTATLLVLQSTLSIAAPWSKNAVHDLEKRITCHTNEISIIDVSALPQMLDIEPLFTNVWLLVLRSMQGLAKPFQSNQQPFKPTIVANGDGTTCIADHYKARVVIATPSPNRLDSTVTCTGQNGALDQNLVKTVNGNAVVFLKGYCSDYFNSSFVIANKAQGACEEGFVTPDGQVS